MRLEPVKVPPHFLVRCLQCGKQMNTAQEPVYADLDGPAFRAYYCETDSLILLTNRLV